MIKWLSIDANSLSHSLMGDSTKRQIPILLPPNYSASRSEPYPVVAVLAGYGSHPAKFIHSSSVFERPLATRLLHAMENKTCAEAIIVFPDCTSALGGSQYINSPVLGNYMDFLCDELIPLVDQTYHTHTDRRFRAITGHSSGGYGAMVTSMLRPDVFAHMASSAGDCFFEALFMPLITPTLIAIKQAGDVEAFMTRFLNDTIPGHRGNFEAMMMLAMAPCFAPNEERPILLGDLFFSLHDGKIDQSIWQRYLAWDPVHMCAKHLDSLAKMHTIRLDCGRSDPYGMQWGQQQIATQLEHANIAVELNEYSGGHNHQSARQVERISSILSTIQNSY